MTTNKPEFLSKEMLSAEHNRAFEAAAQLNPDEILARARRQLADDITASKDAADEAYARGDTAAGLEHWKRHVGLLEVQMGRTNSADRLTMTPAVPATR